MWAALWLDEFLTCLEVQALTGNETNIRDLVPLFWMLREKEKKNQIKILPQKQYPFYNLKKHVNFLASN